MFVKMLQGSVLSILCFLFSFLAMLLPNFTIKGSMFGGGPLRQWFVNFFVFPLTPNNLATQLLDYFNNTSALGEWLLIAPFLFVMSLAFIPVSLLFIRLCDK